MSALHKQANPSTRLVWLDICRILAILAIVGFHIIYEFTLDNNTRIIGYEGVSIFFITSGFILAKFYPKLFSFDLKWFLKRYVKIASFYYPTIIVIALLFFPQPLLERLFDIFIHLFFMNWISFDYSFSIISPAWFVVPIMAFYIFFPYINKFTNKYGFFVAISVLITLINRFFDPSLVSFSPFFFMAEFCFGIALSNNQKDIFMLSPLLLAVINPFMILSFGIFYIFYAYLNKLTLFADAVSKIGSRTFEIFLFHESFMKVILGKWVIFGLDTLLSFIILCVALLVTMKIRTLIESTILPKIN